MNNGNTPQRDNTIYDPQSMKAWVLDNIANELGIPRLPDLGG
ncbi:MAG: hypothetical protein ACR2PA_00040 [Hyphomicrobiaceae bacterium]